MMTENSLLSDLCGICNNNIPKYQCPRCHSRTCSLPCYKRHQKWSQCSGIRDPTAYVKRSRLATASGIDHDFNFLTRVERAVDNADRDVQNRGLDLQNGLSLGPRQGTNLQRALEESAVVFRRAPIGMSRQKTNRTRISMRKNLMWTVEWIHPDDTKSLGECLEDDRLEHAYEDKFRLPIKKRRRKHMHGRSETEAPDAKRSKSDSFTAKQLGPLSDQNETSPKQTRNSSPQPDPQQEHAVPTHTASAGPTDNVKEEEDDEEDEVTIITERPTSPPAAKPPKLYFYLVKPFTRAGERVLIPTDSQTPFAGCLHGQEVFEYPTVQVLKEPPDSLPAGFTLEADYLKKTNKLIQEV